MKETILIELVRKWEKDAQDPEVMNGSPEAQIRNAEDRGIRKGIAMCACNLYELVLLLGSNEDNDRDRPVVYDRTSYPTHRI